MGKLLFSERTDAKAMFSQCFNCEADSIYQEERLSYNINEITYLEFYQEYQYVNEDLNVSVELGA